MAPQPWRDNWVIARDIKTHYVDAGDGGPPVVLLHGGGPGSSGAAGFRFMIPALAEHFRVYAPDQLSYGLTDAPSIAWPVLAHQSLVNHIRDWMDAMCLDGVCMVGNSQGAYVAAKYTLDHPGRVAKLFLIGSGTISQAMGLQTPVTPGHVALREFDGTEAKMRDFLEAIVLDKATITPDLLRDRTAAYNRPGIPEMTEVFNQARAKVQANAFWHERFMLTESLPKMTIPTTFVWGKEDRFAPVELGYELEKMLPNVSFQYIDDAGHQCQTDQPEQVNKWAIDFFLGR